MPRLAPVKIAELVRTLVEALRPQVECSDLKLELDLPPSLPTVLADREQIGRVLAHLISNAQRGTRRAAARFRSHCNRGVTDHVAISVADTGPGHCA